MMEAGHTVKFRTIVFQRVLAIYKDSLKNHKEGTKKMYRSKRERDVQKDKEGRTNKSNWFRKGEVTTTFKCPSTVNGSLGKLVKKTF